jgi:hypothetical protein
MIFSLVLGLALASHGQTETVRYIPRISGGDVQLSVVVTYAPSGASGYSNTQYIYHYDTVRLRRHIVSERAFQLAEATRLNAAAEAAQARADSLYAALEVLNEGLGAVDGPEPLREPSRPDDSPVLRWGAILRNDENEVG